jgi:3-hydroxyacyl-[acyl-carrier-protein] dehydratase
VRPGDQLQLKAKLVMHRRNMWRFDCEASVDGKVAVEAEILMAAGKDV